MRFSVFIPSTATTETPVPALYWLSGLTCTDENFAQKATIAFKTANEKGIAIVLPDTSPRGAGCPEETDSYDFGVGAGFYINATNPLYAENYNMDNYIMNELPQVIAQSIPALTDKRSIIGHSMGGHGALTLYLKNSDKFLSCSAFAPITNPMNCPWGQKAFSKYFGAQADNEGLWASHDATALLKKFAVDGGDISRPILIHVGGADQFGEEQLRTSSFMETANAVNANVKCHIVEGYDHSYFFISSFIEEHIVFHAQYLL